MLNDQKVIASEREKVQTCPLRVKIAALFPVFVITTFNGKFKAKSGTKNKRDFPLTALTEQN